MPARVRGGASTPHGDHRIAMLGAIAGLVLASTACAWTTPSAIGVSFPGFRDILRRSRRPWRSAQ